MRIVYICCIVYGLMLSAIVIAQGIDMKKELKPLAEKQASGALIVPASLVISHQYTLFSEGVARHIRAMDPPTIIPPKQFELAALGICNPRYKVCRR